MRESDDGRISPVKVNGDFDGLTRAGAINAMHEAYDRDYYKGLGQVIPRRHRGLGRLFGALISPLPASAIDCGIPAVQRVLEILVIAVVLGGTASAQTWSGKPNTAAESAAILAGGDHWSNASRPVAPLPEGVLGTPLPGSPIVYYWTTWWPRGGYGYGFGRGRSGFRRRR